MEKCWLCTKVFVNITDLKAHIFSREHRRQSVVCPWCFREERTFTRVNDLSAHCKQRHFTTTNHLPRNVFGVAAGFYMSVYPEDYARVVTPASWDSSEAIEVRRLMSRWMNTLIYPLVKIENWRRGWKSGLKVQVVTAVKKDSSEESSGEKETIKKGKETAEKTEQEYPDDVLDLSMKKRRRIRALSESDSEDSDKVDGDQGKNSKADKIDGVEKASGNGRKKESGKVMTSENSRKKFKSSDEDKVSVENEKEENSVAKKSMSRKSKDEGLEENVKEKRQSKKCKVGEDDKHKEKRNECSDDSHVSLKKSEGNRKQKEKRSESSDDCHADLKKKSESTSKQNENKSENSDDCHVGLKKKNEGNEDSHESLKKENEGYECSSKVKSDDKSKTDMVGKTESEEKCMNKIGDSVEVKEKCENRNGEKMVEEEKRNKEEFNDESEKVDKRKQLEEYIKDLYEDDSKEENESQMEVDMMNEKGDCKGNEKVESNTDETNKEEVTYKMSEGKESMKVNERGYMDAADIKEVESAVASITKEQSDNRLKDVDMNNNVCNMNEAGRETDSKETDGNFEQCTSGTQDAECNVDTSVNSTKTKRKLTWARDPVTGQIRKTIEKRVIPASTSEASHSTIWPNKEEEPKTLYTGTKLNLTDERYSEMARQLLSTGSMPLVPPARRDWNGQRMQLDLGSNTLEWPPSGWLRMTPDRKLLAWEHTSMLVEEALTGSPVSCTMSRSYLLDKYNFLALPGTGKVKKEDSEKASCKSRFYLYQMLKEIANGKVPSDVEVAQIQMIKSRKNPHDALVSLLQKMSQVPLRLN